MEVSSTSSTCQRAEPRWAPTRADHDATRAITADHDNPWRRAHGPHRHDLGVGHHRPGQAPGESPLELVVVLQVALAAAVAAEAAPVPHQRHRPARCRQVMCPPTPDVVHAPAGEPTMRAA